MMSDLGTIVFEGGPLAWTGVLLAAVGAVVSLVTMRRDGRRALPPLALRLVALCLLALCLLEPSWIGEEAEPGANVVVVVADNSVGMKVSDAGETLTRAETMASILTEESGADAEWLAEIESTFALRRFAMDRGLRRVDEFRELEFEGTASAIGGSLEGLARRFDGQPVAAVVLLSDGIATDGLDPEVLKRLPPVYPVLIGGDAPERDLGIRSASVSESAFEDAPLTFRADVEARGFRGREVAVRLLDGAGVELERVGFVPESETDSRSVRFRHRPEEAGVRFFRIEISSDGGREATDANNTRLLTVNRGNAIRRVIYVSGRPNWEYKFLNRAVEDDPQVEMVGLIRIARREPKFQWRARRGESANPLFRGFDPEDDTADYDQPVIVRMFSRDDAELAGGFPREAEELFEYDAVIIDDLERSFFTMDQLELLENYVARRGGSLLMLGGAESFAHGDYGNTPMERMLPVRIGNPSAGPPAEAFRLSLTRDGWLSPWMRLRETEAGERERLDGMVPFQSLNAVGETKPGATVLAEVEADGRKFPALVAQRFGEGRVGALTVGDFWRWGFRSPEQMADLGKSWRQLVRWMLADVPERCEIRLTGGGEGAVTARVRVRDASFEPHADAKVDVTIESGTGEPITLGASPSETEAGEFEVTFVPEEGAMTVVKATARDAAGLVVGEVAEGWVANGAADEFRRLDANRELMEEIATSTGGRLIETGSLAGFAEKLPRMDLPETRTWTKSLWHTPYVFQLVLACFAGEWFMRRRAGLA